MTAARARPGRLLAPFRATVTDAPVSYTVYSAFSYYAARRGGELPGVWLVGAGRALGHGLAAVRQTLYRMERSRELESRTAGRAKHYRLSPFARAEAEAGLARIMRAEPGRWDGRWSLVHFHGTADDRIEQERLCEILRAEGFATIGPGWYIRPGGRTRRLLTAASAPGAERLIEVFQAQRMDPEDDREFVAGRWDLVALAERYRAFVSRYAPFSGGRDWGPFRDEPDRERAAFVLRFALVFDYLEITRDDPDLPAQLLPPGWPGTTARRLTRTLYRRLLPAALAFGDTLGSTGRAIPKAASRR